MDRQQASGDLMNAEIRNQRITPVHLFLDLRHHIKSVDAQFVARYLRSKVASQMLLAWLESAGRRDHAIQNAGDAEHGNARFRKGVKDYKIRGHQICDAKNSYLCELRVVKLSKAKVRFYLKPRTTQRYVKKCET